MSQDDVDRETDRSDAILIARLKHILETPGISHKDRQLIAGNLERLLEAQGRRKRGESSTEIP